MSREAYISAQLAALKIATEPAILAANKWYNSLYSWNERIPLSPPVLPGEDMDHVTLQRMEEETDKEKPAYKKIYSLSYAVSYVTFQGEGMLSEWSRHPIIAKKGNKMLVKVKPAMVSNPYTERAKHKKITSDESEDEERKGVVRRVYMRASKGGTSRIYLVGDISANSQKDSAKKDEIWDTAEALDD